MKTVRLTICFCAAVLSAGAVLAREAPATNPFYAFVNCFNGPQYASPEVQVRILKELGYEGISYSGTKGAPEMLKALDAAGLKFFNTYVGLNLDAEQKYGAALTETITLLKGRDAMLWLYVTGRKYKRGSEEGDRVAVEAIRELADLAHESGVKIALYPHTGFYAESLDDALRIAEKVNRRNVGVTFNLCHWLKVDGDKDPSETLQRAMPYLFQVSINGADSGDTKTMNWNRLIQPLGSGTYDVGGVLKTLKELGYAGPVGLQGYAVKGDSKENLKRSIQAWRKLSDSLRSAERTLRNR